jgi:hypothetical protein
MLKNMILNQDSTISNSDFSGGGLKNHVFASGEFCIFVLFDRIFENFKMSS